MDIGAISKPLGQSVAPTAVGGASGTAAQNASASPVAVPEAEERVQAGALASGPKQEAGREQIEDAVASIQEFVQSVRRSINFSVEDGSGRVVVKVTDAESGNVIRQIPSEEALKLAENLSEVRSLLFEAEA